MKMNQMECYSDRQSHVAKQNYRSSLPSSISMSSDSSDSSAPSVILSMCPLSIDSNNYLLTNDNQSIINTDETKHSLENTSCCTICKKLKSLDQVDQCCQCHKNGLRGRLGSFRLTSNDRTPDPGLIRSHSFNIKRKLNTDEKSVSETDGNETVVLTQSKTTKKLSFQLIMRLLKFQRQCQSSTDSSSISTQSCLYQLLLQPKLFVQTDDIETTDCPPVPISVPCVQLSTERINQFKQRQIELDRTVQKLIETVIITTNENLNQILRYWSYIKQLSLDKLQPKNNRYQLFDYILKFTFSNKQYELYFEENDEIKAALQVLSTTLTIVQEKYSYSTINKLFDSEERSTLGYLHEQLESLLSSYTDELSFIRERLHFYQSRSAEEKNFDWIQIIQVDYPYLIEKISNDFIIKTPQIDQILIQMLRNMKKHLLNIDIEINKK